MKNGGRVEWMMNLQNGAREQSSDTPELGFLDKFLAPRMRDLN